MFPAVAFEAADPLMSVADEHIRGWMSSQCILDKARSVVEVQVVVHNRKSYTFAVAITPHSELHAIARSHSDVAIGGTAVDILLASRARLPLSTPCTAKQRQAKD